MLNRAGRIDELAADYSNFRAMKVSDHMVEPILVYRLHIVVKENAKVTFRRPGRQVVHLRGIKRSAVTQLGTPTRLSDERTYFGLRSVIDDNDVPVRIPGM